MATRSEPPDVSTGSENSLDVLKLVGNVEYNIPKVSVFSLQLKQALCSTLVGNRVKQRNRGSLYYCDTGELHTASKLSNHFVEPKV